MADTKSTAEEVKPLAVWCPKCGVLPGEACVVGKFSNSFLTHAERSALAKKQPPKRVVEKKAPLPKKSQPGLRVVSTIDPLAVPCPKCYASPHNPCLGQREVMKVVHFERKLKAKK